MVDREIAVQMRRDGATLQEIGDVFGVTRERIRQVLVKQPRARKCSTDLEKIVYEGLYNYMMDNPKMTFTSLAMVMLNNGGNAASNKIQRFAHGKNCVISKKAYDRLIKKTGMTYEQLFKLREGFEEEGDTE